MSKRNEIIQGEHCRSCGANDAETLYLARQNEGYSECCNKSMTDECGDRCFHLDEDKAAEAQRAADQRRWNIRW